ncbi:MAG: hypothetical protein NTZ48_06090 [Candidatus Omnitrophica bacterium]|nr:hypothetical protein [Candidatus Omnitrophota bacterium]
MDNSNQKHKSFLFFFILFIASTPFAFAEDGNLKKAGDGTYFTVYCQAGIDPIDIATSVDISSSYLLSNNNPNSGEYQILPRILDAIFLEASDILDIHIYSFKGNIKFYRSLNELKSVYLKLFNGELKAPSFYVYDTNTVYISTENIRLGILGHEIAHAIIGNYFVVLPPTKIQEVLSGYVEYQLNKKSRSGLK